MPPALSRRLRLTRLALIAIAIVATVTSGTNAQSLPATETREQLSGVLPEWQEDLHGVLDDASAAYTIDAEIALPSADAEPRIQGTVAVTYTNTTGEPLDALPFRFYANGPDDTHDAMRADTVTRDGEPVASSLDVDQTVLHVELEPALAPGATTTVTMEFTLAVPVNAREHYGILNIDVERGTWALAHWYPILAGRDPERGWVLDPPSENGDPIFSTTASYDLTLRAPAEWRVVSTGVTTSTTVDGSITETHVLTGPVRDLTVVLDDDFESVETVVDGTTITSWYNPGDERIGEAVLDYAAQSLAYFNDLIGPYPYTTLDLVPVNLFGAAGVEFPQLIYMGASYYTPDYSLATPNSLDFTVAHEVLHQWWYGMVGNNQYDHAFIDEGLTNYMSSELYFTAMYGPEAGAVMVDRYLAGPFHSNVTTGNDQIVDTPTDAFPSGSAYVFAAYSKGPMGFKAIHDEIGADAFAAGVQQYFLHNQFSVASPDDLLNAFEAASGQELDTLWRHWFEEAAGLDDV